MVIIQSSFTTKRTDLQKNVPSRLSQPDWRTTPHRQADPTYRLEILPPISRATLNGLDSWYGETKIMYSACRRPILLDHDF